MGWFDSQLRQRRNQDNDEFSGALEAVAGAVMGKRLLDALDDGEIARSAIEAILKSYHLKPLSDEEISPKAKTLDEQLDEQLRPYSILRRNIHLDGDWYRYASGPMLGTLKESGAAVALLTNRFGSYYYIDFSTGKKVNINGQTKDALDIEAVCFYRPLPLKELTVADLVKFGTEQVTLADNIRYIGAMALYALVGMLVPQFSKWLFGDILDSKSMSMLTMLAIFILCYSISSVMIFVFKNMMLDRIRTKQNIAVRAAVMNRIISLPPRFFRQYSSGELYQRAMNVQSLSNLLIDTLGNTGLTAMFSLVYIVQIIWFAPSLVLPAIGIILLNTVVSLAATFIQSSYTRRYMEHEAKTSGLTYSIITGIQKIKLAGAERRIFAKWARSYAKDAALLYNPSTFIKINGAIQLFINGAGTILLYAMAIKGGVSIPEYYAFITAFGLVSAAFNSMTDMASKFASIRPTLDMARPIMETVPEVSEGKKPIDRISGGIEISNVSFRYDDSMPNIIDNLSLTIRPGEYIAIVGTTGCGKSTLLRLLLGFETPQKGTIYYDRRDMRTIDKQTLRQKIGTVMQDGKLFNSDIYSNIAISAPGLSLKDAWEAARIASIDEDIKRMPMGMSTLISEGHGGISGGQRQRIMIARAIAPKPKILIFDEATSALDNITQKKVSEAIDSLTCTRIVVAHRLSTIKHCDRIIVLDGGRVAEDGTYDELIAKEGLFKELVKLQQVEAAS